MVTLVLTIYNTTYNHICFYNVYTDGLSDGLNLPTQEEIRGNSQHDKDEQESENIQSKISVKHVQFLQSRLRILEVAIYLKCTKKFSNACYSQQSTLRMQRLNLPGNTLVSLGRSRKWSKQFPRNRIWCNWDMWSIVDKLVSRRSWRRILRRGGKAPTSPARGTRRFARSSLHLPWDPLIAQQKISINKWPRTWRIALYPLADSLGSTRRWRTIYKIQSEKQRMRE